MPIWSVGSTRRSPRSWRYWSRRTRHGNGSGASSIWHVLGAPAARLAPVVPGANAKRGHLPSSLAERGSPPFVGRASELRRLGELLAETRHGARRVAFVAGEPGIGKTRLVTELARIAATRGFTVLHGRAEDESVVPFQPFVEALRPYAATLSADALRESLRALGPELAILLPELATVVPEWGHPMQLEPEVARYHMFESVAGFVDAIVCDGPVLLLLDDLHWADPATLELLARVGRDRDRGHLLVVGTYRSTGLHPDGALARTLTRLASGLDLGLDLYGLDQDDVEAFIQDLTTGASRRDLAHRLQSQTGGNPFFLVETVRHLAEPDGSIGGDVGLLIDVGVPATVRGVLALRFGDLSRRCAQVLDVAAVIGRRFDLELVAELVGHTEAEVMDALDEAMTESIVEEEPGAVGWYRFRHAITREAIVDALSVNRVLRLHRAVGEAIESRSVDERAVRISDLARHFTAAAPLGSAEREKAVDYSVRAGDRAMQSLAFEDAVEHYRSAQTTLGGLTRGDDEVECRILLRRRDAESRSGDAAAAQRSLEGLIELTEKRPAAGGLSFLLDAESWRPPPWGYDTKADL